MLLFKPGYAYPRVTTLALKKFPTESEAPEALSSQYSYKPKAVFQVGGELCTSLKAPPFRVQDHRLHGEDLGNPRPRTY